MALSQQGAFALHHQRRTLYLPQQRPGFTAWAAAFDYAPGRLGLGFTGTPPARGPNYPPPPRVVGGILSLLLKGNGRSRSRCTEQAVLRTGSLSFRLSPEGELTRHRLKRRCGRRIACLSEL